MKELLRYLNPVARLGVRKYSVWLPLFISLATCIISELYTYGIAKDPLAVGQYIIFVNVAFIIYFSFRDGIRGGVITTFIAIFYYFYIIATRHYTGKEFTAGVDTTFILFCLYLLISIIIGWLKQVIDSLIISEKNARHSTEEERIRLQTVLQQLPVGVLIVDKDTGTIESNDQMEKVIGRRIKPYLEQDKSYKALSFHRKQKPLQQTEWPLVRALQKGEVVAGEEIEFIGEDNKSQHLRVNAAPIKNKHGRIIAAVSTIDDISHEKDLEQKKDDFVNMASHELKTPLTSMKLFIDSLFMQIKKYDDPRATKTVVSIRRQTEKLEQLVGGLLDISRIQTGKLFFQKEKFPLYPLIKEVMDMIQGMTEKHAIIYQGKRSFMLYADRFRIYQVLTNLLTNAVKYSPEGKEIIIHAKEEKGKVIVGVQDFGIGISKNVQKKIFERLYQVRDPDEKTFPGLGMGLYISKEIIKKHKGSIWVESQRGKGSTFFFSIPIKKEK